MTRRQYSGGATTASLASGINGVDTTISCTTLTNWPDGTVGPFFIVIGRGTASEEKILCASRTGNTLYVASGGRGADGTSATSHSTGAVVEHVFTATDADEANYHVNTAASTASIAIHGLVDGSYVVGTIDTQTLENKTLDSPDLTGVPTAPTAAASVNDTQVATTAYVKSQATSTTPIVDGTATVGTLATGFALGDHVHPTDTSRAPLASPAFTGNPTAPTPAANDNDTSIATTAFVNTAISNAINEVIQRGSTTITVAAGDVFNTTLITFATAFSSTPTVMAITRGGNSLTAAAGFNAYIGGTLSTTQVTLGVRRGDNGTSGSPVTITVDWIAIGPA